MHDKNTLQLRRCTPQDVTLVITWPQSPTEAQWWAGPQTDWPVPTTAVQRRHTDPDVRPYILSDGMRVLGYGELWMDAEEQEVELARLLVAPAHRGQGVGVALVLFLLEEAKGTNYPRAFLRVVPHNDAAIVCYRRAGCTPVSPAEQQSFNQGQPLAYLWMQYVLGKQ